MPRKRNTLWAVCAGIAALAWSAPPPALAGKADIVEVVASQAGDGTWRFDVTVAHADEGWDHYADAWQILGADDTVLGTRELVHPHVDEQPFSRSLSGVNLPQDLTQVRIRAHDSVHGWGEAVTFDLPDQP